MNEEENKNKITLEDVLNNEEDFLLAMKEQQEEFINTCNLYMQQKTKTQINPVEYFVDFKFKTNKKIIGGKWEFHF